MWLYYYVYRLILLEVVALKEGKPLPYVLTISKNLGYWIYLPFIAMAAVTLAVALGSIKSPRLWIVFATIILSTFILWSIMAAAGLGWAFMPLPPL